MRVIERSGNLTDDPDSLAGRPDQLWPQGAAGDELHDHDSFQPAKACFPLQRHGLDPSEPFFHPFAFALADGVASVPGRAPIDRAPPIRIVLRHVRSDIEVTHRGNKGSCIVSTIPGPRDASRLRLAADHGLRGFAASRRGVIRNTRTIRTTFTLR